MNLFRLTAALVAGLTLSGQAAPSKYVEGQIWEYRARPQDAGSLLKIQKVEALGGDRIYHVSITGVHYGASPAPQNLQHIPVSDRTLNASVTRLAPSGAVFPALDFEEGVAEWRNAKGGVFTIPVADIVDIIDTQMRKHLRDQ
jgi:hypothetical protein